MDNQNTYHSQTAKLIATIVQNMPEIPADVMQGFIENPMSVGKVLKEAFCPPEQVPGLKVWKTIKLGTGLKTAKDFRNELKKNNRIGVWGDDILGQSAFTVSDIEKEVDLVNISVEELGFKDGATRKDIYDRALELGLQLCPEEVGPQLRLQYTDQPKGEWLRVAMEPIADSDGDLNVFDVAHDSDGRWLNGNNGHPDNFWNGDNRWLFLRSKSFYFSSDYLSGEFCFVSCPFHPPSIFPISSIFTEMAIYFLLSNDFVSQRIIKSILSVSILRIARRT